MKFKFSLILISICFVSNLFAQSDFTIVKDKSYKNAILVEGLGHGFFYSLNYERIISDNERIKITAQIGVAYYGESNGLVPLLIPISCNQLFRVATYQYIETGIGKTFKDDGVYISKDNYVNNYKFNTWTFRLGYRVHSRNERWVVRAAYTPMLQDREGFVHWGSLAVGYRF